MQKRVLVVLLGLLAPIARSQRAVDHLRALGDGEAPEVALVAMGADAVPLLTSYLNGEQIREGGFAARLGSLLRVLELLGRDAAPLAAPLEQFLVEREHDLDDELRVRGGSVVASLQPYGGIEQWHTLFHSFAHKVDVAAKARFFSEMIRLSERSSVRDLASVDGLVTLLADDRFGAREVAAEQLGHLGHAPAFDLLRDRLLDRDRPAAGGGDVRHNGFPVPVEDRFAWSASAAMIALAPHDPRCAIVYAHRARLHPHREARVAAMMTLASLGPGVADAIPELLELAEGDDDRIAIDAVNLLGLAGPAVAPFVSRLAALTTDVDADGEPSPRARAVSGLVARLRRGLPDASTTLASATGDERAALAARVAALDDQTSAEATEALARNAQAWPLLVDRFRRERGATPDAVLELLRRQGWQRGEEDRLTLRLAATMTEGDCWRAPRMSMSSGSSDKVPLRFCRFIGALKVDPDASPARLVELLQDDNTAVRLTAVERLAERAPEWLASGSSVESVRDALLASVAAEHPDECTFDHHGNVRQKKKVDLAAVIRSRAAAALLRVDTPAERHGELLAAIGAHPDGAVVIAAIERWGGPATRDELLQLSTKDSREAVRAAARVRLRWSRPIRATARSPASPRSR